METLSLEPIEEVDFSDDDLCKFQDLYENLVFEGGGIRGIAFGGVIKCLDELGVLKKLNVLLEVVLEPLLLLVWQLDTLIKK